jgi:hypothetical protein
MAKPFKNSIKFPKKIATTGEVVAISVFIFQNTLSHIFPIERIQELGEFQFNSKVLLN